MAGPLLSLRGRSSILSLRRHRFISSIGMALRAFFDLGV